MIKFELLLGYYIGINAILKFMETPPTDNLCSCLQYNEERERERLEKVRNSEQYKEILAIKNAINDVDCMTDVNFSDLNKIIEMLPKGVK
jgi:hypothetical protein